MHAWRAVDLLHDPAMGSKANRSKALRALLSSSTSGLVLALAGCAAPDPFVAADLDTSRLPVADTTIDVPGLGPCTDSADRRLRLNASQPLTVLVHGCFGSSGQFRALAQVLAFQGQQSACFTYDDRAALDTSAGELRRSVEQLAEAGLPQVSVVGHSQGALIARKAMTDVLPPPLATVPSDLRLVTISGPFAGIDAARTCGRTWLYPLTLGLLPLGCHLVTGAKWADITFSSPFIVDPGPLSAQVREHLKIDTDERGSCRREQAGRCVESDLIFSLDEQRHAAVDAGPRVTRVEVAAGHVEIVGDKRVAPTKLLDILQRHGVLRATAPEQRDSFDAQLARIYRQPPSR